MLRVLTAIGLRRPPDAISCGRRAAIVSTLSDTTPLMASVTAAPVVLYRIGNIDVPVDFANSSKTSLAVVLAIPTLIEPGLALAAAIRFLEDRGPRPVRQAAQRRAGTVPFERNACCAVVASRVSIFSKSCRLP